MNRQRHNGVRKVCHCDRDTWDTCGHPWHFNFKPRQTKPPAGWLAKRNRYGQPRKASQWPGYRFSLDVFFKRKVRDRHEAEQLAEKLRAMITTRHKIPLTSAKNKSFVKLPYGRKNFGYTYLVSDPPFLKIGRTDNINKRWRGQASTDNPRMLTVVDVIEQDVEDWIQAECEAFHHRGEWFHDVPEVRATFQKIKSTVMQSDSLGKSASTTEKYG